jgi:hypothetical protein
LPGAAGNIGFGLNREAVAFIVMDYIMAKGEEHLYQSQQPG